jgi:uncharacterized membrane protein YdjX (TVP38/TMEM64 family)
MKAGKLGLVLVLALLVAAFFALGGPRYLSFEAIKAQQAALANHYAANQAATVGAFFVVYVVVTALSLPGAALMTLVAGAIFGLVIGTVVVSFASSIGATLAFLASRFLLRDWVQAKFGARLSGINAGVAREGGFYLFTLRLIPVFPFFVINLLMGLTRIKTRTFFWVSQLGMLPATIVFVNAGTQISRIETTSGLLSPTLIASFVALAFFPWAAKAIVALVKRSRG